ncbi:MAG: hypothetical protein FWG87_04520 [Defluviitaleaceae bacterium]|nr:hypothetical protein [Defluviitaleaceae bacterium]
MGKRGFVGQTCERQTYERHTHEWQTCEWQTCERQNLHDFVGDGFIRPEVATLCVNGCCPPKITTHKIDRALSAQKLPCTKLTGRCLSKNCHALR